MMYDIFSFENVRFLSTSKHEADGFKMSSFPGNGFYMPFWCPETPISCWRKALKRREKNLRFKKYPDTR